jgi:dipeptidyl aminopeptidase/acylaminoacyl peptidase
MVDTLPYGSWPSPLSAAITAAASARFEGAAFVGDEVWWGESVADEGGRTAVRRRGADGEIHDVLAAPWNARSRVHEYGGGSWAAADDGRLFFVEKSDQRVWTVREGGVPTPLTTDDGDTRYGGLSWQEGRLLAVREAHRDGATPHRSIVSISADGEGVTTLAEGTDFVAQPALSPGARFLAWVAWDHPHMPWDQTSVRVAAMDGRGDAEGGHAVIGTGHSAPLQPVWHGEHELLYVDDTSDRWNLRRRRVEASSAAPGGVVVGEPAVVSPADADTGGPLWVLGARWYAVLDDGRIVAVRTDGDDELDLIDIHGDRHPIDLPPRSRVGIEHARGSRVLVSGVARGRSGIWLVDVDDDGGGAVEEVRVARLPVEEAWLPAARAVTFDGPHGAVHAFAYAPTHPGLTGPEGERPPYLVWVHGGPTAHVAGVADAKVAYFTSRGIGVLDVNYGGSTGYGRAYRERLRGQWGVVDVDDVAAAARGLVDAGEADPARLAIEGGSAGGWTVLATLVGSDVFAAGISRYGVGDARTLAADTHDFEARYLDGLIGPLPEAEQLYIERSPLSSPDGFRVPLLLLQGADDAVVPPAQSEAVRDALRARGVPHAYVLYDGEGHGFRRTETIIHALETELAFLGEVFGFEAPGVAPVELTTGQDTDQTTA